jgi:hypothetical protein
MSRNKSFFPQVRISHILRFISICGLFTDSSSYVSDVMAALGSEIGPQGSTMAARRIFPCVRRMFVLCGTT